MTRAGPPKAVVFDLDGTLIDSLPVVLRAIAFALEPYGSRPTAEIFGHLGGPPERFLLTLLSDPKDLPDALDRMLRFHGEHWNTIQPFDGVRGFLEQLRAAEVAMAIWTGRDRDSTGRLMSQLGLTPFFATVLCGDDLATHKPDPEGLREIMRRLRVTANETVFVGDADVDVFGGVACGVDTILIRHERMIADATLGQSWQHVATPHEALELVRRCLKRVEPA
ncbi:MAG: hypothetical protein RIQ93_114 [Verrucomicrobiota bacterium]|jgi:HAD superfamily hydrolase (TIGR01509 family)